MRHRTEVTKYIPVIRRARPPWWVAKCDCGWQGREMDTESKANDDADEHVRMMAGES